MAEDLEILQGTLDLLVLKALSIGPMHGYAVSRFIRQRSLENLTVQDGALYAALHRLEAQKLVVAHWGVSAKGKRAKYYQLNSLGLRRLREATDKWSRYSGAVNSVLETAAGFT
ncbi:MAG: PadR family transcriptional regulator [Gemmatimonadales bacterium]|nr:PadR family transcriptional regulator [Gemmatimonadales bacterium]